MSFMLRAIGCVLRVPFLLYFVVVGSALFSCLLIGSTYFPAQTGPVNREVDKSIIRIYSARIVGPAPVVIVDRAPAALIGSDTSKTLALAE
jgi:hypothetical protein